MCSSDLPFRVNCTFPPVAEVGKVPETVILVFAPFTVPCPVMEKAREALKVPFVTKVTGFVLPAGVKRTVPVKKPFEKTFMVRLAFCPVVVVILLCKKLPEATPVLLSKTEPEVVLQPCVSPKRLRVAKQPNQRISDLISLLIFTDDLSFWKMVER